MMSSTRTALETLREEGARALYAHYRDGLVAGGQCPNPSWSELGEMDRSFWLEGADALLELPAFAALLARMSRLEAIAKPLAHLYCGDADFVEHAIETNRGLMTAVGTLPPQLLVDAADVLGIEPPPPPD